MKNSNNNWGHFITGAKETLNRAERIRLPKKLCKGCGKPLSIFEGQKIFHERCLPHRVKTPNWRR